MRGLRSRMQEPYAFVAFGTLQKSGLPRIRKASFPPRFTRLPKHDGSRWLLSKTLPDPLVYLEVQQNSSHSSSQLGHPYELRSTFLASQKDMDPSRRTLVKTVVWMACNLSALHALAEPSTLSLAATSCRFRGVPTSKLQSSVWFGPKLEYSLDPKCWGSHEEVFSFKPTCSPKQVVWHAPA